MVEPDEARVVSLEQALTGVEDGHWVEMRGYVRGKPARGPDASGSEHIERRLPGVGSSVAIIRALRAPSFAVRGVCATTADARHQLTGIQMWVPDVKYIEVQEPAPNDLFAGPIDPFTACGSSICRMRSTKSADDRDGHIARAGPLFIPAGWRWRRLRLEPAAGRASEPETGWKWWASRAIRDEGFS